MTEKFDKNQYTEKQDQKETAIIKKPASDNPTIEKYSGTEEELKKVADMTNKNKVNNISSHIYFNNDVHGYAVDNAKTLIRMTS